MGSGTDTALTDNGPAELTLSPPFIKNRVEVGFRINWSRKVVAYTLFFGS